MCEERTRWDQADGMLPLDREEIFGRRHTDWAIDQEVSTAAELEEDFACFRGLGFWWQAQQRVWEHAWRKHVARQRNFKIE